ncbi:DUF4917 family protein [Francisella philomiragia]|uniref:DUF4917 family protein n=1 Tax=Francisella philomiragia TaxID=28110 RepID=UPI001C9D730A|nr:DUF4917 family protein [Francisella philomiragia]MBY7734832.1 DUF4917 family protein [Francisella philomiragia]
MSVNNDIKTSTYKEVISEIKDKENHLLLGNGFNYGLGVNTGYKEIFKKMLDNHGIYQDAENIVTNSNYDLEEFIGKISENITNDNKFLKKYIANKIKLDFMKATHEIVKSSIKNVYSEKNEGIYLLLSKFTNYFTLNYDSFLYLLLLQFKISDKNKEKAISFTSSLKFIEEDMNENQNNIYKEIKELRVNGTLTITFEGIGNTTNMANLTKTHFEAEIKKYNKDNNKNWKIKDIQRVAKLIWEEEKKNNILENVDDGSRLDLGIDEHVFYVENRTQNLFFLHGAFHIYKDKKYIKKITKSTDKALYDKLEEIINCEEKDIVCVFQANDKIEEINNNEYLKKAHQKLSELSGSLVIIGCSISDNDKHIFDQINESNIDTIYISSTKNSVATIKNQAEIMFPNKKIVLFLAETISYELPDKQEK